MEERLKKVLAATLNFPAGQINESSSPRTIPQWDSLKQMQIMLAVEDEFGVQFADDDIHQLSDYVLIREALTKLLGK